MKIEKEHAKSALMQKSKEYLVEEIMRLEKNSNVLHDTIDNQYNNFIDILDEESKKLKHEINRHEYYKHEYFAECELREKLEDAYNTLLKECTQEKFIAERTNND